jgi:hypothetical protein
MTGVLMESTHTIENWTISASTTTDPYNRYLTVECYNGATQTTYTLLSNAVVSGSFSYSWTSTSAPHCVFTSGGDYIENTYFILTTYVGSWTVNIYGWY